MAEQEPFRYLNRHYWSLSITMLTTQLSLQRNSTPQSVSAVVDLILLTLNHTSAIAALASTDKTVLMGSTRMGSYVDLHPRRIRWKQEICVITFIIYD